MHPFMICFHLNKVPLHDEGAIWMFILLFINSAAGLMLNGGMFSARIIQQLTLLASRKTYISTPDIYHLGDTVAQLFLIALVTLNVNTKVTVSAFTEISIKN